MCCVSVDIEACTAVRLEKNKPRHLTCAAPSLHVLSTATVQYLSICMATILPTVRIEFPPACGPKICRLLIFCPLEEHGACYRKTMSVAEQTTRLRFSTSGQHSVGILHQYLRHATT